MKRAPATTHASALLLVLWALLLLTAAVFAWAASIHDGVRLQAEGNHAVEARAMAHSGMALALHPGVTIRTRLPEETLGRGMSYQVRIVSEGGKLNINWLLRGEEPQKLAILQKWLEQRGLNFQEQEVLVDCLLDYVDTDDLKRLNGREKTSTYQPADRDLQNVSEIARVANSAPLTSSPGWENDLTIYSQGPIDLETASLEILRLLPGLGETALQQFVQYRQGPDGKDGTEDDVVFDSLDTIRQFLGLTNAQFKEISGLVTYGDPTLQITSVGRSGNVTRQVEAVVRKTNTKTQILSWKE